MRNVLVTSILAGVLCQTPVFAMSRSAPSGAAYLVTDGNKIIIMDEGGGNKKVLVTDGMTPSWTPDGHVIFLGLRGSPQIWTMDADGSNQKQISKLTWAGVDGAPIMPQQGRNGTIVFQKQSAASSDIRTIKADGTGETVVIGKNQKPSQPSLAISGTWMTYTVETGNPYHRQIWRSNIDGSSARALTSLGDSNYPDANASVISPDEQWVAFFSGKESAPGEAWRTQDPKTYGYRNVATAPAAGGPRHLVTTCRPLSDPSPRGPQDCFAADNPFWYPDGTRIGYDTNFGTTWASDKGSGNARQVLPVTRGMVRVVVKP